MFVHVSLGPWGQKLTSWRELIAFSSLFLPPRIEGIQTSNPGSNSAVTVPLMHKLN